MLKFVITKESMDLINKKQKFILLRKYGKNFIELYIQFKSLREIKVELESQNDQEKKVVTLVGYEGLELYDEKNRVVKALERRFAKDKKQWYEVELFANWLPKDKHKLEEYIEWLNIYFNDSKFILIYYIKK
ncbi:hypothetical protein [Spiroplasma tabanidicola]|uniref:Uncharacterized protein n=1 Tax=Spiroplasma tabanidicola TaxID=324079 RepID=A0A6I6C9J4_9MOLU|nr:hypothetical protein [Spiroplasma tabanidicola]QGS51595.1 hypothetical protein STABA_v1c02280 [Spiroplasma tabanidicola]